MQSDLDVFKPPDVVVYRVLGARVEFIYNLFFVRGGYQVVGSTVFGIVGISGFQSRPA